MSRNDPARNAGTTEDREGHGPSLLISALGTRRFPVGSWLALLLLCAGCTGLRQQPRPITTPPGGAPVRWGEFSRPAGSASEAARLKLCLNDGASALDPGGASREEVPSLGMGTANRSQEPPLLRRFADAGPFDVQLGQPQPFPGTAQPFPSKPERGSEAPSAASPSPSRGAPVAWTSRLQSTGRRPIQTLHESGSPAERSSGSTTLRRSRTIKIMGSIYGNEPESVRLMDALLALRSESSLPVDVELILLRTPNPDGLAESIRTNQNGVDLNRNFPSTWFSAQPDRLTGPYPASEVETQHLLRLFKENQPVRVIHVRSSIGRRPLVLLNEKWAGSLKGSSLPPDVDLGRFEGDFKAGSVEEFVSIRLGAELATILLPPSGFQQMTAEELLRFAFGQAPADAGRPAGPSRSGTAAAESAPAADGERGYVELLPPPPEFSDPPSAALYYELPPPPGDQ